MLINSRSIAETHYQLGVAKFLEDKYICKLGTAIPNGLNKDLESYAREMYDLHQDLWSQKGGITILGGRARVEQFLVSLWRQKHLTSEDIVLLVYMLMLTVIS